MSTEGFGGDNKNGGNPIEKIISRILIPGKDDHLMTAEQHEKVVERANQFASDNNIDIDTPDGEKKIEAFVLEMLSAKDDAARVDLTYKVSDVGLVEDVKRPE